MFILDKIFFASCDLTIILTLTLDKVPQSSMNNS